LRQSTNSAKSALFAEFVLWQIANINFDGFFGFARTQDF